jgi:hypothetical protein
MNHNRDGWTFADVRVRRLLVGHLSKNCKNRYIYPG